MIIRAARGHSGRIVVLTRPQSHLSESEKKRVVHPPRTPPRRRDHTHHVDRRGPALAWTGLCRDDPAQRLSAVPSAAFDQQVHSAVVRRLSGGMDDLHVVLSGGPVRRLQLRAPGGQPAVVARTSPRAIGNLAGGRPAAADRPRRKLETHRQRHSDGQNPVAAAGSRGPAVFRPLDHQPVDSGLVHAAATRAVRRTACMPCRTSALWRRC